MAVIPMADEVRAAREVLRRHLPETRLVRANALSRLLGARVSLKLESELPTGSFKPRGALYALATRLTAGPVSRVVASSTGNHGAAVAWAGSTLGVPVTIFLPDSPNPAKRARIAEHDADIVEGGSDLAAATVAAREFAAAENAYLLDDATDRDLPAGPATIATEIFEQAPDTAAIFVPVGDTALIRGIASVSRAQQRKVRIIGVQASLAPAYYKSWKAGRRMPTDTCATIADGLATRTPELTNVRAIRGLVDEMVLVTDEQMLEAMRLLLLEEHIVAEPAGAAATAAALVHFRIDVPTVLLVTGANLSADLLGQMACATAATP